MSSTKEEKILTVSEDEILALDAGIQSCVNALFDEYNQKRGSKNGEETNTREFPSEEANRLFTAYSQSPWFLPKSDIKEYWIKFYENIEADVRSDALDVLYPVLFYSVVMNNAINPNSALRRSKRNEDKPETKKADRRLGRTNRLLQHVPFGIKLPQNKLDAIDESREKLIVVSCALTEHIENWQEDLVAKSIDFIHGLLNKELIAKIEGNGKTGIFIRNLLLLDSSSKPLETILRLYAINRITHIISRVGNINTGHLGDVPTNNLLTEYWTKNKKSQSSSAQEKLICFQFDPSATFSEQYKNLTKNVSFSSESVESIINYFLDETNLKMYAHYCEDVCNYCKSAIATFNELLDIVEEKDRIIAPMIMECVENVAHINELLNTIGPIIATTQNE